MKSPFKTGLYWLLARYPRKLVIAVVVSVLVAVAAVYILWAITNFNIAEALGLIILVPLLAYVIGGAAVLGVLTIWDAVSQFVENLVPERKRHDDGEGE